MSDFPKHSLVRALRVAALIENANGGKPMPPTEIAIGLEVSPGSSDFRVLLSSSHRYGLTLGSYKQPKIELTDLATAILLPFNEQGRQAAMCGAALNPPAFRGLFDHFKGKKLPEGTFLENTLVRDFGIPRLHAAKCAEVFRENLESVGLLRQATTGPWVSSVDELPLVHASVLTAGQSADHRTLTSGQSETEENDACPLPVPMPISASDSKKVFVSHGRNRELVPQLKELLTFGQFEPVVSVERESVSKPIPEKVLDDMRLCGAAIIHVDAEEKVVTQTGEITVTLNQNVLIEIGAAMALYRRRFILLVKNGVSLPSNLHGLYQVRYDGEKLDGDATLRLLKAFNEFKSEAFHTAH